MAAKDRQVGGDHYQRRIQPWDVIDEYGLDYYEGNAIKYILRWKGDRVEDLKKAIHYLEKEIELYEESEKEAPWGLFMTDEEREEAVNTASREPLDVYNAALRKDWPTHTCENCGVTYVVSPSIQHCPSCYTHVTYSPL